MHRPEKRPLAKHGFSFLTDTAHIMSEKFVACRCYADRKFWSMLPNVESVSVLTKAFLQEAEDLSHIQCLAWRIPFPQLLHYPPSWCLQLLPWSFAMLVVVPCVWYEIVATNLSPAIGHNFTTVCNVVCMQVRTFIRFASWQKSSPPRLEIRC